LISPNLFAYFFDKKVGKGGFGGISPPNRLQPIVSFQIYVTQKYQYSKQIFKFLWGSVAKGWEN